ncbi:MAG: PQQ-binding-like beta-propeller repeat protein, partial [Planctomycetales bacterium]|nr:PQQ-binding-like beta-propeller repeat protein [Planctomycetales bacterium]
GDYLARQLGVDVKVSFAETIANALQNKGVDGADLIIGKDSVVRHEGARLKLQPHPLAQLSGKDGSTTQQGWVVVWSGDAAQSIGDLKGYRILFGPPDCAEKFAAARRLLASHRIELPPVEACETSEACSDGAAMVVGWGDSQRAAAVISSYAAPLLEGCGTIKKGDLRVVGKTEPVPFVTAFATKALDADQQAALREALLDTATEPELLTALESLLGFLEMPSDGQRTLPVDAPPPTAPSDDGAVHDVATPVSWSGWLGPSRNGHCQWLPKQLPSKLDVAWRVATVRPGLGGLAATHDCVIFGDRDAVNLSDVFRCLSAQSGEERWTVTYPAPGQLDYDNLPRATPLIAGDRVVLFGAFGDLTCARLDSGEVLWQTNVRRQFLAIDELPWGTCSSPLLVDNAVIVNPGAPDASLVAYDLESGAVLWQTPGEPQGYGSLIVAELGGKRQIVGHTQSTLHGWDPQSGRELWSLIPPVDGDFHVPTPTVIGDRLLIASENNATRLFDFDAEGSIVPKPTAVFDELSPDISSPIAIGNQAFCVAERLVWLDATEGLKLVDALEDDAFADNGAILVHGDRLLVQGRGGELLLVSATNRRLQIMARGQLANVEKGRREPPLSYPAICGAHLYLRVGSDVYCVRLPRS